MDPYSPIESQAEKTLPVGRLRFNMNLLVEEGNPFSTRQFSRLARFIDTAGFFFLQSK